MHCYQTSDRTPTNKFTWSRNRNVLLLDIECIVLKKEVVCLGLRNHDRLNLGRLGRWVLNDWQMGVVIIERIAECCRTVWHHHLVTQLKGSGSRIESSEVALMAQWLRCRTLMNCRHAWTIGLCWELTWQARSMNIGYGLIGLNITPFNPSKNGI